MLYNKLLTICFFITKYWWPGAIVWQARQHNLSHELQTAGDSNTSYAIDQIAGHSVGEVFLAFEQLSTKGYLRAG